MEDDNRSMRSENLSSPGKLQYSTASRIASMKKKIQPRNVEVYHNEGDQSVQNSGVGGQSSHQASQLQFNN